MPLLYFYAFKEHNQPRPIRKKRGNGTVNWSPNDITSNRRNWKSGEELQYINIENAKVSEAFFVTFYLPY
jgi:hypothetical protein